MSLKVACLSERAEAPQERLVKLQLRGCRLLLILVLRGTVERTPSDFALDGIKRYRQWPVCSCMPVPVAAAATARRAVSFYVHTVRSIM